MSDLRLNLDTVDFKELVELGRSMIPTVAPGWTDHNIHDPGIMLMELVAWIADAEIYALSHASRGERQAYGRLLGLELTGPQPAHGLIWPLAADAPAGTPVRWGAGSVVDVARRVTGDRPQAPAFYTTHRIELTTAELTKVVTQFADGSTRDWTRANSQQGATFLPFSENPHQGDRLVLTLNGELIAAPATQAAISIGFEIISDAPSGDADDSANGDGKPCIPVRLQVSLSDATGPWPVSIEEDTTAGLSHSGVLLLKVDPQLADEKGPFTLSIQSEGGIFLLPPRLQRIALNVLPVEQVEPIPDEENSSFGTGMPDQVYTLKRSGLIYPLDDTAFSVFVGDGGTTMEQWRRTTDLSSADPDAPVYAVDVAKETVLFGNGINGRIPIVKAALRVAYRVTAGAEGNLRRGIQWSVTGVPAPFGVNSEATTGGSDPRDLARLKATARSRVRKARPIVTTADLQDAALTFTDLDVRRAQELLAGVSAPRVSGARVLVAVGPHDSQPEADTFAESALWLGEIRRRLTPRLPLGQSLDVIALRMVEVRVIAHLVAAPQRNPDEVSAEVEKTLRAKLAITATDDTAVWMFGRDVTLLMVKGWLRNVEGVARVVDVALRSPALSKSGDRVELSAIELPRLRIESGDITIDRSPAGGAA
jgi:hypothetical protein